HPGGFMPVQLTASQFESLRSGKPVKARTSAKKSPKLHGSEPVNVARITVPLTPVSVNHYKVPCVINGIPQFYLTDEAKAYTDAVILAAEGQWVSAKAYYVAF